MTIADELRARIESGQYAPDGSIGTYQSLQDILSVPEKKLRAALYELRDQGKIIISSGNGMWINPRPDIRFCAFGKHYAPLESFAPQKVTPRNPDGRQPYCQPHGRLNSQLRWHNMTQDEYYQRLTDQNGKCACCGCILVKIQIDHDHACCSSGSSCGKCTRALLCVECNQTLGRSHDDIDRLRAAANYLSRYEGVV